MRIACAAATHKADTHPALEAFPARDGDETDHPGPWHMSAAARGKIEISHFDETQHAGPLRFLPKR
jgi:hypothetical protein